MNIPKLIEKLTFAFYICAVSWKQRVSPSVRGRPPQNKRKGMPVESAPPNIKFHFCSLSSLILACTSGYFSASPQLL